MDLATVLSKNGVSIRLTNERWNHIKTAHPEIDPDDFDRFIKVISDPEFILKGSKKELLAVKKVPGKKLWIVVPYIEIERHNGFVLTAYYTNDLKWLFKKEIIWNKE